MRFLGRRTPLKGKSYLLLLNTEFHSFQLSSFWEKARSLPQTGTEMGLEL